MTIDIGDMAAELGSIRQKNPSLKPICNHWFPSLKNADHYQWSLPKEKYKRRDQKIMPMCLKKNFFRQRIKNLNLTIKDVMKAVGHTTNSNVYEWLRGGRMPTKKNRTALSLLLNSAIEELFYFGVPRDSRASR